MLDELYQEIILDHYKNPRCKGCLECPHRESCVFNPLCGDRIKLSLNIVNNRIDEICFDGEGCAISQASGSIMCDLCKGRSLDEIDGLREEFTQILSRKSDANMGEKFGDASCLEGVKKFPARVRCAVLAWEALRECIEESSEKSAAV